MTDAFRHDEPRPGLVAIAGDLRHASAGKLADLLFGLLERHDALHIDLLNVSEADVTTVQTMLMVAREGRAQGKSVRFTGYGLAVEELVSLLDVQHLLGGPMAVVWD